MEDIVLKYNQLDPSAKELLLDFLDFLIQKQPKKAKIQPQKEEDDWLTIIGKMGEDADSRGLTDEILNEILNEK